MYADALMLTIFVFRDAIYMDAVLNQLRAEGLTCALKM